MYARTVFDPLAIIAADGSVQPYLAQSITPNADATVWTITMRPNLLFHDNTPVMPQRWPITSTPTRTPCSPGRR